MKKSLGIKIFVTLFSVLTALALRPDTDTKAGVITAERPLGGLSYYLERYYNSNPEMSIPELIIESTAIPENIAFANVDDYLNIRSSADISSKIVGYLPKSGMCQILDTKAGWAHIKSGRIEGYVSKEYLVTGNEAKEKAEMLSTLMVTVKAGTVNLRSEPDSSNDENILTTVNRGNKLPIIEECVIAKDDKDHLAWIKVYCDDLEGYIVNEESLVEIGYSWDTAVSLSQVLNGETSVGANSLRMSLVTEAKKHIGLKYVWGGNSLKTGCDCSGFCLAVYRACGINTSSLPRSSYDIAASSKGKTVSL